MEITNGEIKKRTGFILLSFFAFYLVGPVRDYMNANFQVNPFIIGFAGLLLTLYLFEF